MFNSIKKQAYKLELCKNKKLIIFLIYYCQSRILVRISKRMKTLNKLILTLIEIKIKIQNKGNLEEYILYKKFSKLSTKT